MNKETKFSAATTARINSFIELFSKETEDIRRAIITQLPAYNTLLNCYAKTFEDFALIPVIKEQGISYEVPLFNFRSYKPICIKCGEKKRISRKTENKYICSSCGKVYSANHNSISSGTKVSSVVWMQVLHCMLNFYSLKKTCDYCNISRNTYYQIRNRLFYGMQLFMDEVKLYGEIQCDNTFTHISFKGMDLSDKDYPEDSPFDDSDFIPREARKRGGRYQHKDKNINSMCIFTAIDSSGHVFARSTGVGSPSATRLSRTVGQMKFLKSVPETDPFLYMDENSVHKDCISLNETFFVSDKESAIIKFVEKMGYPIEAHVYRKKGHAVRLSKNAHSIQRVNNLHKKLKEFLRKANYVSSKYLPGYLVLFEFIENTGATDKAIGHLFEILSTPGLGKPAGYFEELFTVPNYLIDTGSDDNPLSRFSYNQLYACYLYNKHKKEYDIHKFTNAVKQISEITDYSSSSIRRLYKNLDASGLISDVISLFEKEESALEKIKKKTTKKAEGIRPEIIAVFDEFCVFCKVRSSERIPVNQFFENMNKKYGLTYSREGWRKLCHKVVDMGYRDKYPALHSNEYIVDGFSPTVQKRVMKTYRIYEELVNGYHLRNEKLPLRKDLFAQISAQIGLSVSTVDKEIQLAKKIKKASGESAINSKQE